MLLDYEGGLGDIAGVVRTQAHNHGVELFLDGTTAPQQVLVQLLDQGITVNGFEVATPPLHDIFLQVVGEGQ